jgi:hypothetical protein
MGETKSKVPGPLTTIPAVHHPSVTFDEIDSNTIILI